MRLLWLMYRHRFDTVVVYHTNDAGSAYESYVGYVFVFRFFLFFLSEPPITTNHHHHHFTAIPSEQRTRSGTDSKHKYRRTWYVSTPTEILTNLTKITTTNTKVILLPGRSAPILGESNPKNYYSLE